MYCLNPPMSEPPEGKSTPFFFFFYYFLEKNESEALFTDDLQLHFLDVTQRW